MESYGAQLKTRREERNLDIHTVERETSISADFLTALELEQFSKFPSTVYFTGFLRTYAEYLDLDAEALLRLFRAKMIQASPVPAGLLLRRRSGIAIPIIAAVMALSLGGAFLLWRYLESRDVPEPELVEAPGDITYRLTAAVPLRRRVYPGNKVVIPGELLGGESGNDVILEVLSASSVLSLKTPLGEQFVTLGEEVEIDVDENPGADIILFVSDISPTDSSLGAELRMVLKNGAAETTPVIPASAVSGGPMVLFEDRRAYPFTFRITFQDQCLLRQQVDNREKQENLYINGEVVTMQANNGIRLWASNARAMTMQIIADTKTYELAKEQVSRVIARDIRWVLTGGVYQMAVIELD